MNALVFKFGASYPAIEFRGLDALGDDNAIVWADRPGFLRAIGNLLSNAGRHAKSLVNIETKSEAGVTVINVDDNGEGIPASDRERVFEPFVRLENGSNGNGRGVGLGLALVKRIAVTIVWYT